MTRQRRTHLLILTLVPAVVFAAVRCGDYAATGPSAEGSAPLDAGVPAKLAKLHDKNDWVGKFHNDALNDVLASLKRIPLNARDSRTVCEAARRAYADFHRAHRGRNVPPSVDAEFEGFCEGGASIAAARSVALAPPSGRRNAQLTVSAQDLMAQIVAAVDFATSYADLSNRVNSIDASAASTLSYDEAGAVVTLGAVTLSSADYWMNNIESWIPYTQTLAYSVIFASRAPSYALGVSGAPVNPSAGWGTFWDDTKNAARRAAGGDARAAVKAIIGASLLSGPLIYDVILGTAAAGSIMAVLQM